MDICSPSIVLDLLETNKWLLFNAVSCYLCFLLKLYRLLCKKNILSDRMVINLFSYDSFR